MERYNYEYPSAPEEPWPAIVYTVTLNRATSFYANIIILPTMIVTILSFATFFTPTAATDSLSYGITVIVVVVLMQVVLMGLLPICGEVLWCVPSRPGGDRGPCGAVCALACVASADARAACPAPHS